jgi:hypothetical protein
VLIKICLASIPIYLLSFIKFPKWGIRLLEFQMAHCLWNNTADCHRYHLASWQHVTMLKEYGGMGVPSIRAESMFVRFLVKKVLFRWGGGGIWKNLLDFKYNTSNSNVFTCRDAVASNF